LKPFHLFFRLFITTMIEPKKRGLEMAVVPVGVKRPRTELVSAAQSQQLSAMVKLRAELD